MSKIDELLQKQYEETLLDVQYTSVNEEEYSARMRKLEMLNKLIMEREKNDLERKRLDLDTRSKEEEIKIKREQVKGEKANRVVGWITGIGTLVTTGITTILGFTMWKGSMRFEETGSFTSKSLRTVKDHMPNFLNRK